MEEKPDVKPQVGEGRRLNIKMRSQNGDEMMFLLKDSTKFAKVFQSYSEKVGIPVESLRIMFDGNRVQDTDTPQSLGLEEEDTLDVYVYQIGGAY
jgi:small ubiquitin-related modifier